MTSHSKSLELQITRHLQGRRSELPLPVSSAAPSRWGDRLIAVLSVTVCLVVVGSFLEELLWAVLAAATIFALGADG